VVVGWKHIRKARPGLLPRQQPGRPIEEDRVDPAFGGRQKQPNNLEICLPDSFARDTIVESGAARRVQYRLVDALG